MNCIEQLGRLGLNGRQAKVYLALLQLGSASAIELARTTGFKHPTVYDVLEALKQRGLVSEGVSGGRKRFAAEDPETLRREEAGRMSVLDEVLPDLKRLFSGGEKRPAVRFFQGREGVLAIHSELLGVEDGEYFYFGSLLDMQPRSSVEDRRDYVRERVRRGIRSYSIRVRGKEGDEVFMQPGEQHLREVRFLPREIDSEIAELYLFSGKVAIISALKENYSMIIESRELFALLKTVWLCIWEIAEPAAPR